MFVVSLMFRLTEQFELFVWSCTKTRNNETKRPKRNHRNERNETTETSETAETKRPKRPKQAKINEKLKLKNKTFILHQLYPRV